MPVSEGFIDFVEELPGANTQGDNHGRNSRKFKRNCANGFGIQPETCGIKNINLHLLGCKT
jgi:hypothetical protein